MKSIFHRSMEINLSESAKLLNDFGEYCWCHLENNEENTLRITDIKIALAELINNTIIHGFHKMPIENCYMVLEAEFHAGELKISFYDNGQQISQSTIFDVNRSSPVESDKSLPEKGFGWFLIHQIFEIIDYRSEATAKGHHNRLLLKEKYKPTEIEYFNPPKNHASNIFSFLFCLSTLFIGWGTAEVQASPRLEQCKVVGKGYIQMPGLESCFKISGRVRIDVDQHFETNFQELKIDSLLKFDFAKETEWGTFNSHLSLLGERLYTAGAGATEKMEISKLFFKLPNLFLGYNASTWVRNDWGGYTIKSGPFAYHESFQAQWQKKTPVFDFQIAAEWPDESKLLLPALITYGAIKGRWGKAFGSIVAAQSEIDSSEILVTKLGLELKLDRLQKGAKFKIQSSIGVDSTKTYLEGERFDFLSSLKIPIKKNLTFNTTFGTSDDFEEDFTLAANLVWKPVQNFKILGEIDYSPKQGLGTFLRIERKF